jgi:hypothetical protein
MLRETAPVAPYAVENGRIFVGKDVGCITATAFLLVLGAVCKQ